MSQASIQNALAEIVGHLRGGGSLSRSSTVQPQSYHNRSPSMQSMGSPPLSASHTGSGMEMSHNMHTPQNVHSANNFGPTRASLPPVITGQQHQHRGSVPHANMISPVQGPVSTTQYHPPQLPPSYNSFTAPTQMYNNGGSSQPMLPPFSSLQSGGSHPNNTSSVRYSSQRDSFGVSSASGSKRTAPPSSNVTSASTSDFEADNDHDGELPASGLTAPWEVLRNLASVAIQQEAHVRFLFLDNKYHFLIF